MDVQLALSGLEIDIAERLQTAYLKLGKFNEHAAVLCEPLKVGMTLPIQVGTHPFNLKIGHIAHATVQGAFVRPRPAELKPLNQTAMRQHLPRCAYDLAEAYIAGKDTYNVRTAGDPDNRLVLLRL